MKKVHLNTFFLVARKGFEAEVPLKLCWRCKRCFRIWVFAGCTSAFLGDFHSQWYIHRSVVRYVFYQFFCCYCCYETLFV